jgi:iron-sulfur cluster assembly protein
MESLNLSLEQDEILLDRLLKHGVEIAHDCGGTLACASCRVVVREGLERLDAASEEELDMLDRSGAAAPGARLACQVKGAAELVLEIPRRDAPPRAVMQPISISERAAQHFAHQLEKHPGAIAVRLAVEPAGCSGLRYRIDPAETIRDDDAVIESGGVRVVVDPGSLPYLQGSTLDVVHEGLARRLRFDNPNARQSCGCGESFSA